MLDELENEIKYLREDILDLATMEPIKFEYLERELVLRTRQQEETQQVHDTVTVEAANESEATESSRVANRTRNYSRSKTTTRIQKIGLKFDCPTIYVIQAIRRLRDRLYYDPIKTHFKIQFFRRLRDDSPLTSLISEFNIKTSDANDLDYLIPAAERLISKENFYLSKIIPVVEKTGELSVFNQEKFKLLSKRIGIDAGGAQDLQGKVVTPFKSLETKQEHFKRVLTNVIKPKSDPEDDRWEDFRDLAEELGLPIDIAKKIFREHLNATQKKRAFIQKQAEIEAEKARKQKEAEAKAKQEQKAKARYLENLEDYRKVCHEYLSKSLYPAVFDQGQLEQARLLRNLSADDTRKIEEEVRSENFGDIKSDVGVDYTRLRQLLWSRNWKAADEETERVIFEAVKHEDYEPLSYEDIRKIPSVDLLTIDQLWSLSSKDKFGFSSQLKLFQQVGRDPLKFLLEVSWRKQRSLFFWPWRNSKPYRDLDFGDSALPGHLPTWRWTCHSLEDAYSISEDIVETFFNWFQNYLSADAPAPLTPTQNSPSGNESHE
jgi:hypothetical protein